MMMPRTVDEILKHADELATRFQEYEPSDNDELDVEEDSEGRLPARGRRRGVPRLRF